MGLSKVRGLEGLHHHRGAGTSAEGLSFSLKLMNQVLGFGVWGFRLRGYSTGFRGSGVEALSGFKA